MYGRWAWLTRFCVFAVLPVKGCSSTSSTDHKSQGSEFDHVCLVLPPSPSPVITRELLYTAVTRAREQVTVFATADVLREGMAARVERHSGLRSLIERGLGQPGR